MKKVKGLSDVRKNGNYGTRLVEAAMGTKELVTEYLKALEGGNLEGVLALFTPDGVVYSPIYGKAPARDFYVGIFKDSPKTEVKLLGLLGRGETTSGGTMTGYWARFSNVLARGAHHELEVVVVMELKGDKISALHIVMDTAFIRPTFDKDTERAPTGQQPAPAK